jgi:hypothetical protein
VCLAFTGHASLLCPHCIDRRKLCRTEKPADKRRPSRELFRVACSCNENALRNIFGALPVASVAERDTVNKSNSTVNELGEGRFGAFEGVAAEKFWVFHHCASLRYRRTLPKSHIFAGRNGDFFSLHRWLSRAESHPALCFKAAWETPDDISEDYAKQLNGDQKRERINKKNGRPEWAWKRVGENHA